MAPGLQDIMLGAALAVPTTILLTLAALLAHRRIQRKRSVMKALAGEGALADESASGGLVAEDGEESPPFVSPAVERDALRPRIEAAQRHGDMVAAASHYIELARVEEAAGDEAAQLAALRSAAGLASLHGAPALHAAARLGLAEIAARSGDLTSACEHWQLARVALTDDGNKELAAKVDKRMRDNGCPTDWVLTDF